MTLRYFIKRNNIEILQSIKSQIISFIVNKFEHTDSMTLTTYVMVLSNENLFIDTLVIDYKIVTFDPELVIDLTIKPNCIYKTEINDLCFFINSFC